MHYYSLAGVFQKLIRYFNLNMDFNEIMCLKKWYPLSVCIYCTVYVCVYVCITGQDCSRTCTLGFINKGFFKGIPNYNFIVFKMIIKHYQLK